MDPQPLKIHLRRRLKSRNYFCNKSKDWNQGDIDEFMKPYWNSDQLTFSSGGKVTRGYARTLQGYKERYPDAKTMGNVGLRKA